MEMATAPKMQLFMTFMIVYFMIGNTVSIYSIFAVVQSIVSSVGSILKTNKGKVNATQCSRHLRIGRRA